MTLGLIACGTPPPEAPAELGELSIYLFERFEDDAEVLISGVENLEALFVDVDLGSSNIDDRAFTLPRLTRDHFGGIEGSPADVAAQVPVAAAWRSPRSVQAHDTLVAEPNHVCIESDTTKYYAREFLTDLDCYVDGSCDRVETVNEVLKQNALATVWYDLHRVYRRFTLDDGREVGISRAWLDDVFTGTGNSSWDQIYGVELWIEDADNADRAVRYFAMWSSITLALIGDDAYAGLVKNGIDQSFQFTDDFLDGTMCGVDREREYDRPE